MIRLLSRLICVTLAVTALPSLAQTKLTGDIPFIGDRFGQSVAIQGNIAVVGATGDETNGDDAGAAYVYQNTSGSWDFLQKLTGEDLQAQFGFSVAVVLDGPGMNEGDFIAVGSKFGNGVVPSSGTVSIYRRIASAALFELQQTVSAGDGSGFDEFGYAIALDLRVPGNSQSGDPVYTLAVGAPDEESGGVGFDQGALYIYQLSPDGTAWAGIKKLVPEDLAGGDYFGRSVDISGDFIVAGAIGWPFNNHPDGAAYLIRRFNDTGAGFFNWEVDKLLKASDGEDGDRFGASVSISELGTIVVGSPFSDFTPNGDEGAAYVFGPSPAVSFEINETTKLDPPDPQTAFNFASQVVADQNFVAVSEPLTGGGQVHIFQEKAMDTYLPITILRTGDPQAVSAGATAMALDAFNVIAGDQGINPGGSAYIMTDSVFIANFESAQSP